MKKALVIIWKDVLSEARAKDLLTSFILYALLAMLIFYFALSPDIVDDAAAGVLWVAFTFAGMLGLSRSFFLERERGGIDGLMLCPVGREVVFLGKVGSGFLFMFVAELVIMPVFSIFMNLPLFMPRLVLVAFLVTIGFVSLGTLFAAMAASTRAQELMLPLLFLPTAVPLIIAAVESSALVLAGAPWGEITSWLQMILAFDAIYFVLAIFAFPYVLET